MGDQSDSFRRARFPGAAVLALLAALLLSLSGGGLKFERQLLDTISYTSTGNVYGAEDLIIVALDDITFDLISEELDGLTWPFPRAVHAQLLKNLVAAGVKQVFFDVVFDIPSRFGEEDDLALAELMPQLPIYLAAEQSGQAITPPLEILTSSGGTAVNAALPVDMDGIIRWTPGARILPRSFGEGVSYLLGKPLPVISASSLPAAAEMLTQSPSTAPGLLRYLGPAGTIRRISYYELYSTELARPYFKELRGKTILIGSTPSVSITPEQAADTFLSPLGLMPGVEIHANHALALRSKKLPEPLQGWPIPALLLIWSVIQSWGSRQWPDPLKGFAFISVSLLVWIALVVVALQFAIIVPILLPVTVCFFLYIASLAVHYLTERDERLITRAQLFHYLPAKVAEYVLKNPTRLAMGGDRSEATLLFADVAGFTTLSEECPPEDVLSLLQEHLQAMTEVIFQNQGTLDKYLGDGIMAFWGAPEPQENHADLALKAAVDMLTKVEQQNVERRRRGAPELVLRIGLHSGEAIVGNIGSDLFIDYTAIGDTVNTAARLEGVNKVFDTRLIVSDDCLERLKSPRQFRTYPLGRVAVKGKSDAVGISTVVDPKEEEKYRVLQSALKSFDSGNLESGKRDLIELLTKDPSFVPARFHLDQIAKSGALLGDENGRTYWQLDAK
ncbi:MAG: adenylate/guanylate cyclase domain-containing protein [Deltaproteobacteria bacterium]|nr:adenylate/guanylate cyclase domain-containing protein [Deltaproteobacteria bacterium]